MPESARNQLSHFDESGDASMVDVSAKQATRRTATASAFVELSAAVLAALLRIQGQSAGGCADCWDSGGEAYVRVDSDVPSACADARGRAGRDR